MICVKMFGLPDLPGVSGLSSAEISLDLLELEKVDENDTDSISSVSSSEVLKSTYPVKPRGSIQADKDDYDYTQEDTFSSKEVNNAEIEEALIAIKAYALSNKEVYDAEVEREELEASYRGFEFSYEETMEEFTDLKVQYENYHRLLQACLIRNFRIHAIKAKELLLYSKLFQYLNEKQELLKSLPLPAIPTTTTSTKKSGKKDTTLPKLPQLYRIVIKSAEEEKEQEIVLMHGQVLYTPMGKATILTIDANSKKVELQTSPNNGKVYATIAEVVSWIQKYAQQSSSLVNLKTFYEQQVKEILTIPAQEKEIFHKLHAAVFSTHADTTGSGSDNTDQDEMSSTSMDEDGGGGNHSNEDTAAAAQQEENPNIEMTLTQSSLREFGPVSGRSNASQHSVTSSSSPMMMMKNTMDRFLLPAENTSTNTVNVLTTEKRRKCQAVIEQDIYEKQMMFQKEYQSMIYAPAHQMMSILQQLHTKSSSSSSSTSSVHNDQQKEKEKEKVYPCLDVNALAGTGSLPTMVGRCGRLTWDVDIQEVRSAFATLQQEVFGLETQQNQLIKTLEKVRSDSCRLSKQTSSLRLSMFTRRIAHRNNLNANGIVINYGPPVSTNNPSHSSSTVPRGHKAMVALLAAMDGHHNSTTGTTDVEGILTTTSAKIPPNRSSRSSRNTKVTEEDATTATATAAAVDLLASPSRRIGGNKRGRDDGTAVAIIDMRGEALHFLQEEDGGTTAGTTMAATNTTTVTAAATTNTNMNTITTAATTVTAAATKKRSAASKRKKFM